MPSIAGKYLAHTSAVIEKKWILSSLYYVSSKAYSYMISFSLPLASISNYINSA